MSVVDLLRDGVLLFGLQEAPIGHKKNFIPATMTEKKNLCPPLFINERFGWEIIAIGRLRNNKPWDTTSDETREFREDPHSEDEITVRIIDKKSCVNDARSSTVKLQLNMWIT